MSNDESIDWANEANVAPLDEPFCGYMHNKVMCMNGMIESYSTMGAPNLLKLGIKRKLNFVFDLDSTTNSYLSRLVERWKRDRVLGELGEKSDRVPFSTMSTVLAYPIPDPVSEVTSRLNYRETVTSALSTIISCRFSHSFQKTGALQLHL